MHILYFIYLNKTHHVGNKTVLQNSPTSVQEVNSKALMVKKQQNIKRTAHSKYMMQKMVSS